jgi:hypothetical protein
MERPSRQVGRDTLWATLATQRKDKVLQVKPSRRFFRPTFATTLVEALSVAKLVEGGQPTIV